MLWGQFWHNYYEKNSGHSDINPWSFQLNLISSPQDLCRQFFLTGPDIIFMLLMCGHKNIDLWLIITTLKSDHQWVYADLQNMATDIRIPQTFRNHKTLISFIIKFYYENPFFPQENTILPLTFKWIKHNTDTWSTPVVVWSFLYTDSFCCP